MSIRRLAPPIVVASILLVGCKSAPPPERQVEVSNKGFALDQLFTDDRGDTVYRFYDKDDWRYYVVGPDGHPQMVPSTRSARDRAGYIEPGIGVGIGVGGVIDGGRRRR